MLLHGLVQFREQRRVERAQSGLDAREPGQRFAKLAQVAWPCRAQSYPRKDAFDVADAFQLGL